MKRSNITTPDSTQMNSKATTSPSASDDNVRVIAIHFHKEGHMVTDEDLVYLFDFCDYNFYGKKVIGDLEDLMKSLYLEETNYDRFFDQYLKDGK